MSRAGAGLLVALLIVISITALISQVRADAPVSYTTPPAVRSEPACLSTVEYALGRQGGSELRFTFDWQRPPDGVPVVPTTADEPVRASFSQADAGTPFGGEWRATSHAPGTYSVMVQVPDAGAIEATLHAVELVGTDGEAVPAPGRLDALECASVSEPAIMRDLRLVTVTFDPVLGPPYDAVVASATVSVAAAAGPGTNERRPGERPAAPGFERLYRSQVINHEPDGGGAAAASAGGSGDLSRDPLGQFPHPVCQLGQRPPVKPS